VIGSTRLPLGWRRVVFSARQIIVEALGCIAFLTVVAAGAFVMAALPDPSNSEGMHTQ
jgi:hypothetical protein